MVRVNGYERRTRAKRQAIIEAARELFAQRGVKDVTIREIAARAGVSQVTIYNYFGNKKSLAAEALSAYIDRAVSQQEKILELDLPFKERLERILELKAQKIDEVARSYFSTVAWDDPAFQAVYKEAAYVKALPVYRRFIELARRAGAIDPRIPTEAVMDFMLQVVPLMQHRGFLKTSPEYKLGLLRLFLYGVLGGRGICGESRSETPKRSG